jgi:diguanylate cyclase (GGDEF)-like protein
MKKPIPVKRFVLRKPGTTRAMKSLPVLRRGVQRLVSARQSMMRRELAELKQLRSLKKAALFGRKLKRVESLDAKAGRLISRRLHQLGRIAMLDPEFKAVLNRQFFFERMKQRLRGKGPHSLVYLDMDHLKKINQRFGRKNGGFELLSAYSRALAKIAEQTHGFAGHIGGDEFILYLPFSAYTARALMASDFEHCRIGELRKWPHYNAARAARRITTTYSAGIIQLRAGADVERAEQAADTLCSMAKRRGKKRNTFSVRTDIGKFELERKQKGRIGKKRKR